MSGKADLGTTVRSMAYGLGGSMIAAVAGLALGVVVGRGLGAYDSGRFFSVVAVLTVLGTIGKLGADTGLVRALGRATALGHGALVGRYVWVAVLPPLALGALFAAAVWLAAPVLGPWVGEDSQGLLRAGAPFLLLAGPVMVLAAGLRGLGRMGGFVLVQNVLVPALRPLLVWVVLLAGGGLAGVLLAWNATFVIGMTVAVLLTWRAVRATGTAGTAPPAETVARPFWRFSLFRSMAASLEVALVWGDVLLVAALAGPHAAGIYAAASRFITTGTLAEGAMRIAIAPQISAALATGDLVTTRQLAVGAARGMVLLSWPIYLVLALHGPALLSLFGPEFAAAAGALAILSVAMLLTMSLGTNQTVLLMGGGSGRQTVNKAIALAVDLLLAVLLIPLWGIEGAALAWGLAIVTDALLARWNVRRHLGVAVRFQDSARLAALCLLAFVPVGLVSRLAVPLHIGWALAASMTGGLLLLALLLVLRDRLGVTAVLATLRRPGSRGPAPRPAHRPDPESSGPASCGEDLADRR